MENETRKDGEPRGDHRSHHLDYRNLLDWVATHAAIAVSSSRSPCKTDGQEANDKPNDDRYFFLPIIVHSRKDKNMPRASRQSRQVIAEMSPTFYGIELSDDLISAFATNARRKMKATHSFHELDLKALGQYDEALRLFRNIGWDYLFESAWSSFKGPTLRC